MQRSVTLGARPLNPAREAGDCVLDNMVQDAQCNPAISLFRPWRSVEVARHNRWLAC